MPRVLCFNPGSNSLKFELVETQHAQIRASEGKTIVTGMIDGVGKDTAIIIKQGDDTLHEARLAAGDFEDAATKALRVLRDLELPKPDLAAVRVVHGGSDFNQAVHVDDTVLDKIASRTELAPLHNENSIKIIHALHANEANLEVAVAFDTAFHHSIPEVAWRYPLEKEMADRLGIRKFGFHGISHRYQMEQYAHLTGGKPEESALVTTHLASGSSVCAIRGGKSIDTTMGFTPLEGLMMGTRSGSVDPAIIPFLMRHEHLSADEALNVLEKKSGLLGISGKSLDTRVLEKDTHERSRLALEMYAYRLRTTMGAYLAALGHADAIVFGGGIGENSPDIRALVLAGLVGWGVQVNAGRNQMVMAGDALLSEPTSKVAVWVIHAEEGLQLAHECAQVFANASGGSYN
jgi:acetate kinase